MCSHQVGEVGSLFFDSLDASGNLSSAERTSWAQCHAAIAKSGTNTLFLTLNPSNLYELIDINIDTGSYTTYTALSIIPGASFDNMATQPLAFIDRYSTPFVFGMTNQVRNKVVGFNVGYLVRLSDDFTKRQNVFWSDNTSTGSYTSTQSTASTISTHTIAEEYPWADQGIDAATASGPLPMKDRTSKSWWTHQLSECQSAPHVVRKSYAWDDIVLDSMEDYISDEAKELDEFFVDSLDVIDASYINVNSIRSSCFPSVNSAGFDKVPVDSTTGSEMLIYSPRSYTAEWNVLAPVALASASSSVELKVDEIDVFGDIFHTTSTYAIY